MSITQALSNAVSGLTATARGTETVAANLANALTPGYARREVAQSAQTMGGSAGGVRIDGVVRIVNASLLAETRLAESARAYSSTLLAHTTRMEATVGIAGAAGSLGAALTDFRSAIEAAASRPDDEIRLVQVVQSATKLASRLNSASDAVQKSRTSADQAIASDVAALNSGLERVSYLNRRISVLEADGSDPSSLVDERQRVIDAIAKIVPVQEVAREGGKVALFTKEGAVLLDGSRPTDLSFTTSGQMTAESVVGAGSVTRLVQNGVELTAGQLRLFAGGSLAANFAIRDELAPQLQQDLDALAFDLHQRLADPSVDPTLAGPGLFTDQGAKADAGTITGLAGRIAVSSAVSPDAGGDLWRIRSGLGAAVAGPVGDTSLLLAMSNALNKTIAAPPGSDFEGNGSLTSRFALVESRVSTRRVEAEAQVTIRNSQADTIASRFIADGVDSDAEMQRLLQYEQSYAANARVIQAIGDMMDQLLRI